MNQLILFLDELAVNVSSIFSKMMKENIDVEEFFYFYLKYKTDLGFNEVYLSFDKEMKYCFYKFESDKMLNQEILFNAYGEIISHNSHSNMTNSLSILKHVGNFYKQDLKLIKFGIIKEFQNDDSNNIIFSKDIYCHHYKKLEYKHPIPLRHCHIIDSSSLHILRQKEYQLRAIFNENHQHCLWCNSFTKLVRSHLVSANNLRNLADGTKNLFYSSRLFEDLSSKKLTALMSISEKTGNDQNENFKIACFCENCEKKFKNSDNNFFNKISEITKEIIIKCFGIYMQEARYNNLIIDFIKTKKCDKLNFLIKKIEKERISDDFSNIKNNLSLFIKNKIIINQHPLIFNLIGKPFIEGISLSFYKNYFYIIVITNKDKKMYTNIITNDLTYPKNKTIIIERLYAAITINKYMFYSEDFHKNVKTLAYDLIYDYYNNDFHKSFAHPLLLPKSNYLEKLNQILKNYIFI